MSRPTVECRQCKLNVVSFVDRQVVDALLIDGCRDQQSCHVSMISEVASEIVTISLICPGSSVMTSNSAACPTVTLLRQDCFFEVRRFDSDFVITGRQVDDSIEPFVVGTCSAREIRAGVTHRYRGVRHHRARRVFNSPWMSAAFDCVCPKATPVNMRATKTKTVSGIDSVSNAFRDRNIVVFSLTRLRTLTNARDLKILICSLDQLDEKVVVVSSSHFANDARECVVERGPGLGLMIRETLNYSAFLLKPCNVARSYLVDDVW